MKKVLAVLLLAMVCVGGVCAKDLSRQLDKAPALNVAGAYVYDLRTLENYKKAKDGLAFVNKTDKALKCTPYYVDPKTCEWKKGVEVAELKEKDDRDIINAGKRVNLSEITFIAFTIDPAGNYEIRTDVEHHDLYLYIFEK